MKHICCTTLLAFLFITSHAQTSLYLTTFAGGFTNPLGIESCGDSRLFIVEQGGKIYILDSNGVRNPTPFLDISFEVNDTGNEQGLLGLAFHPDYKRNGYFYVNYIHGSGTGYTRISRFTCNGNNPNHADSTTEKLLLTFPQPYVNHNGGCLKFGPDGYLYDSQGDGGYPVETGDPGNRAQQTDSLEGKILRIDINNGDPYGIPTGNPFVNGGGRPEVWAYGLRNPWRFSFDKITGDVWIADVGHELYEEVDFQPASSRGGINYGWRCYEATHPYGPGAADCQGHFGLTDPIYEYGHYSPCTSITGGYVYRGTRHADLFGKYLFTDYCHGHIETLYPNGIGGYNQADLGLFDTITYTTFGEDINGELYLASKAKGTILKIQDTTECEPVAYINSTDNAGLCGSSLRLQALTGSGFTYQWAKSEKEITGATNSFYDAFDVGTYVVRVKNKNNCSAISNIVTVSTCTGIETLAVSNGLNIFPNPTDGNFNLSCSATCPHAANLKIVNELSETVLTEHIYLQKGENKLLVDLSRQSAGIYFLVLEPAENTRSLKLIINR